MLTFVKVHKNNDRDPKVSYNLVLDVNLSQATNKYEQDPKASYNPVIDVNLSQATNKYGLLVVLGSLL